MMRAETFTRPRSVADAVVTTTTASAFATRSAWLFVDVILPLAVVEQCEQRRRNATARDCRNH